MSATALRRTFRRRGEIYVGREGALLLLKGNDTLDYIFWYRGIYNTRIYISLSLFVSQMFHPLASNHVPALFCQVMMQGATCTVAIIEIFRLVLKRVLDICLELERKY